MPALDSFYERSADGRISAEGGRGCWSGLLYRDGVLHVLGDPSGLSSVFLTNDRAVCGSSFLAVCSFVGRPTLSPQSVFEYVFNGSVLGNGTLVDEVGLLPMNGRLSCDRNGVHLHAPPVPVPSSAGLSREDLLEGSLARLRDEFRRFSSSFGDNISCALSGGYDSRFILALLKDQGVDPHVFVYGRDRDEDVVIAKTIAAGEGFDLEHVDKSEGAPIPPEAYPDQLRRNYLQSDGYTWEGLFTGDGEHRERNRRTGNGRLYLNGGGGEVFRNFFYLPDGRYSVRQVMWTFYAQFDPAWCTARFDEPLYFARLEGKVLDLLGRGDNVDAATRAGGRSPGLERHEIEWLYPSFRCRSWVARENQLANWAGYQVNPFLDPDISRWAAGIPVSWKNFGLFEAELIRRVSPRFASYMSAYGHDFCTRPSLKARVLSAVGQARPPAVRRLSFRIRHRLGGSGPAPYARPPYVAAAFGKTEFLTAELFHLDRIRNADQWNRILTVEYVARALGVGGFSAE